MKSLGFFGKLLLIAAILSIIVAALFLFGVFHGSSDSDVMALDGAWVFDIASTYGDDGLEWWWYSWHQRRADGYRDLGGNPLSPYIFLKQPVITFYGTQFSVTRLTYTRFSSIHPRVTAYERVAHDYELFFNLVRFVDVYGNNIVWWTRNDAGHFDNVFFDSWEQIGYNYNDFPLLMRAPGRIYSTVTSGYFSILEPGELIEFVLSDGTYSAVRFSYSGDSLTLGDWGVTFIRSR